MTTTSNHLGQKKTSRQGVTEKTNFEYMKKSIWRDRWLYVMFSAVFLYFVIFKYIPMLGTVIAFKDYNIGKGIFESEWVGLHHFKRLFTSPNFYKILRNTLRLNLLNLFFGFPVPIILAVLINEVNNIAYKRTVQTVLYIPHFISWVVLGGMIIQLFSIDGPINMFLEKIIPYYTAKSFMGENSSWVVIYVLSGIWQSAGWGTIIYLAAITNVDAQLYEAAKIDGANKFQQILHITLPCIAGTIAVLLIMKVGTMLTVGFEHIYVLQNKGVLEVSDVISTYEYRVGLEGRQYSYTTALGLFKGVIGLVLVMGTNYLTEKLGEEGIW